MVTATTLSGPLLAGSKPRGTRGFVEMGALFNFTFEDNPGNNIPFFTGITIPKNSAIVNIQSFVTAPFNGQLNDLIGVGTQADEKFFAQFTETTGAGFAILNVSIDQAPRWLDVGTTDLPIYIAFEFAVAPTQGASSIFITFLQAFNETLD